MDEEKPRFIGSIATRIVFTLLGLLSLYVLSYGPACFIWRIYPNTYLPWVKLYSPSLTALEYTWPQKVWSDYGDWWWDLAESRAPKFESKTPPTPP